MRIWKTTLYMLLAGMIIFALPLTAQNRSSDDGTGIQGTTRPAGEPIDRAVGTIQYDNNTPFQRDAQVNGMVGNRFTGLNNPHTVTSISFRVAGNYGASVVASIWQPGAGTASLLRRWIVNGVPSGGAATGSTITAPVANRVGSSTTISPIAAHSGNFIAGIRNTFYTGLACTPPSTGLNTTCDGVALTQGVPPLGGPHGVRIQFSDGGFTPSILAVSTSGVDFPQNAIMRSIGESLPVELMSFGID